MIENVPIIYVLKVDIMNNKPRGVMILFYGDTFLPLAQKLQLGYLVDVYIVVSILECLQLGIEQLVLPPRDAVHHLLIVHELVDSLKD